VVSIDQKFEAQEKAVQQMTKDGLVEHTVSGSKETSLSLRPPEHKYDEYEPIDFDALFSRHEAKSRDRAEGGTKEKNGKSPKDGQRKRRGKGRLSFEDETPSDKTMKSGSSGRLVSRAVNAAVDAGRGAVHGKIYQVENENSGVKAAHHAEMLVENSLISAMRKQRKRSNSNRGKRLREEPDEKALKHEPTEKTTALVPTDSNNNLPQKKGTNTPALPSGTNPQQKRYIRVEYRKTVYIRSKGGTSAAGNTAKMAKSKMDKAKEVIANFFKNHKGLWIALAILGVLFILMMIGLGSCSSMTGGVSSSVFATSYPMEDADMQGAENRYLELEAELQEYLDTYESNHDYDEYHFDLDDIAHDPYVLISAITALHGGEWTISDVGSTIQMLFDKQYILTETVTIETRYYTETRTGTTTYTDPETGETITEEYEYEVEIPYDYYICTVELENFNLSHVPVYIMSESQLSTYALLMSVLGNRPDLFPSSDYVSKYYNTEYPKYEIPADAMSDPEFAAMITEAEKYLGYPYVWGGSSPSTSFDCSGFVSYVINNSGIGRNVGRLGADGLLGICTVVSPENARPGDLIFFQGTYDTAGASHVGIYVGNNMMIHCGDPIQYESISTAYWQEHFYYFGRLP
jgi:cell wall-associated NlpC family hydrolase